MQIDSRLKKLETSINPETPEDPIRRHEERVRKGQLEHLKFQDECPHPKSATTLLTQQAAARTPRRTVLMGHCNRCGLHSYVWNIQNTSLEVFERIQYLDWQDAEERRQLAEAVARGEIDHVDTAWPPSEEIQIELLGEIKHRRSSDDFSSAH